MVQLVGACPVHQNAVDLVPSQGTYLGCGFDLQWRRIREATDGCFLSHPCFFLSSSLSKSLNISSGEDLKKKENMIKNNYITMFLEVFPFTFKFFFRWTKSPLQRGYLPYQFLLRTKYYKRINIQYFIFIAFNMVFKLIFRKCKYD